MTAPKASETPTPLTDALIARHEAMDAPNDYDGLRDLAIQVATELGRHARTLERAESEARKALSIEKVFTASYHANLAELERQLSAARAELAALKGNKE